MPDALTDLKSRLGRIDDLTSAAEVLSWDQETYMPPGGADARAQQLSTLHTLAHEQLTDDATGALIEQATDELNGVDRTDPDVALVRVARHDYERARRVPAALVRRMSEAVSQAKEAWKAAREADDFAAFAPHLKRIVALNVEKAEALGYENERYDALLDEYEPGMTTETVATTFQTLRDDLVPIVDAIAEAPPIDDSVLRRHYPEEAQKTFGETIMAEIGYDFERGRQDVSAHPFTTSFAIGDVRLTTRYDESYLPSALFSMLHEAGHGLYEQGIDPVFDRTPVADGASLGMHESQSRFVENMLGRSRAFWEHYFPRAQGAFPEALSDSDAETFYRAVNCVEPSLIRVEADEVTYNLHVMLRFELERGLVRGDVAVDDLPGLWNERMDEYLGVVPDTDANGVLQDVHWSLGSIGYFPTYALGTLMSAQLWDALQDDLPDVQTRVAHGQFGAVLNWLRTQVHRHGRTFEAPDLLERVTGQSLTAEPWLDYVRTKFGALYDIPL